MLIRLLLLICWHVGLIENGVCSGWQLLKLDLLLKHLLLNDLLLFLDHQVSLDWIRSNALYEEDFIDCLVDGLLILAHFLEGLHLLLVNVSLLLVQYLDSQTL